MNETSGETSREITFAVIIPAAGEGSRSGRPLPKQYVELLGHQVLTHTLRPFAGLPGCTEIVVAINEEWRATAESAAAGIPTVGFIAGGSERQHSITNALRALRTSPDLVLVHDAARPCLSRELIQRVVAAAARYGAAIPAMPIIETVKRVGEEGTIIETIPRAQLRTAQTPQGFRRDLLEAAYARAGERGLVGTDDSSLVEAYGAVVHVVEGEQGNIKITVAEDFRRAEELLRVRGQ
jgi:2-C-methyl-D-erythritol 4-phosphate cytidylyltransferase